MGKRGGSKRRSSQPVAEYDSDDERRYSRDPVPDPNSQEYYHDDVDQFHQNRDKILIDKGIKREQADLSSDDQEEVYGLGLESDDDDAEIAGYQRTLRGLRHVTSRKDELGSDVEDGGQDYDERVWGNEKSKYYGADVEDDDIDISDSEGEASAAVLEEKEALALQRKMAEQLEEQDFGLENFTMEKSQSSMTDGERIVKDLSKVSKREKLELLNKQSPELLELIDDYVVKMSTVKDVLQPLRRLIQNGQLPSGKAADYVDSKFSLYLNYCVNITFYMMLKAKCTPVENHPVIKRLLQYRNLIKQLEPLDKLLKPEIDAILERVKRGEELKICGQTTTSHRLKPNIQLMKAALDSTKRRKLSEALEDSGDEETEITKAGSKKKRSKVAESYMTKDESEALEFYQMMKGGRKSVAQGDDGDMDVGEEGVELVSGEIIGEEELEDTDGKRAITYQIAKNKGLTPHRKKEQRNPRVKHRMKYRKAKIRRKGMIREPRKELNPYGGELSGIRAGVKRSVKLK